MLFAASSIHKCGFGSQAFTKTLVLAKKKIQTFNSVNFEILTHLATFSIT